MVLIVEVDQLLLAEEPVSDAILGQLLDEWLTECDRSQPVDDATKYNEMHVVGLGLCALLHGAPLALATYESFCLTVALGRHAPRVVLHDEALSDMSWTQLSETLTALQLVFKDTIEWDAAQGYHTLVDYPALMLVLLKRVGFWLARQWRRVEEDGAGSEDPEALQGLVDLDKEGWRCVRPACVVQVLDGVHALLSLVRLLLTAQLTSLHTPVADDLRDEVRLYNHHREASIDDFYEMSMVADCMVGSVTQYKHKFQFLFHSISQVVYYHYPAYERQRQQPMAFLEGYGISGTNLLPLLLQLNPDIPLFYEHTGAGQRAMYSAHPFSWVFMSGYILLLNREGVAFCAEDLRSLLLLSADSASDVEPV
jgi:hypothetical protein